MSVRDFMTNIDARIFKSRIVNAKMSFPGQTLEGAYFQQPREIQMPGGAIMGIGMSFECHYHSSIATLALNAAVSIDDYGQFRFLRELTPGGDESGLTVIELGEFL